MWLPISLNIDISIYLYEIFLFGKLFYCLIVKIQLYEKNYLFKCDGANLY
jgi:hypothetical protein